MGPWHSNQVRTLKIRPGDSFFEHLAHECLFYRVHLDQMSVRSCVGMHVHVFTCVRTDMSKQLQILHHSGSAHPPVRPPSAVRSPKGPRCPDAHGPRGPMDPMGPMDPGGQWTQMPMDPGGQWIPWGPWFPWFPWDPGNPLSPWVPMGSHGIHWVQKQVSGCKNMFTGL